MKVEKNERTPYILMNTKHFNDVSATAVGPSLPGVLQGQLRIQDQDFARLQNMWQLLLVQIHLLLTGSIVLLFQGKIFQPA